MFMTITLIISIHHDYSYLLDQGPINSIQLDDNLCLCSFQQSKRKEVSLKDCPSKKKFVITDHARDHTCDHSL